jgi:hypothetical protein
LEKEKRGFKSGEWLEIKEVWMGSKDGMGRGK